MTPDAMTPTAHLCFRSNPDTELYLVDGKLQLAANAVETLETDQPPGLYKIRAIRAGKLIERMVIAEPGDNVCEDIFIEGIATIGLSRGALGDGAQAMADALGALNAKLGPVPEDRVAVFLVASAQPDRSGSLFSGMRLFPWRHTDAAAALSTLPSARAEAGGRRWEILRIDAEPGNQVLELPMEGRDIRLTLPVTQGHEMQLSLRHRMRVAETIGDFQHDLPFDIAVQLRRSPDFRLADVGPEGRAGPFWDIISQTEELELEHSARSALAQGRRLALDDRYVWNLLNLKFADPLTGLAAAHLMFDAIETRRERERAKRHLGTVEHVNFSDNVIDSVLGNLSFLFGHTSGRDTMPESPDLAAVFLRAGTEWPEPYPLAHPPLFWRSWQVLQGHQHRDHVAITPKLWSETKLNQAWGPYFTWQPHQMSLKKFVDRFAADSAQVDALVAEFHAEAASRASTETPMTGFSQDAVAAAKASQTAPEPKGGKRNAQLQQTARLMGIPGHVAKKLL